MDRQKRGLRQEGRRERPQQRRVRGRTDRRTDVAGGQLLPLRSRSRRRRDVLLRSPTRRRLRHQFGQRLLRRYVFLSSRIQLIKRGYHS